METQYEKLKKILRQMFQMDQADLDFGIYRIMNQKRAEIEDFLDKELLPQVKEEFSKYKSVDAGEKQKELDRLEKTVKESGLDPDDSPKVSELREQLAEYGDEESLVNEVFSHLTIFFRRYYDSGDFLSLRRYKKDTYAIPYEGEEVKLHWANADQYYIKSTEYLRDYTFKVGGDKRVHFKLIDATEEKDNIKQEQGKERKFKLYDEEPIKIEENELYIQFTYLPDKTKQADMNKKTLEYVDSIFRELKDKGFQDIILNKPTAKNPKRTLFEKHLNDYTARFNFDFFIHKDLGGFLERELDFYIKNEILFIDDLDEQDEKKIIQSIGKIKVLKHIAQKIISFLTQLEEFQKKMWLKKKFVVDCGYCVTLDRVPEELYEEIAKNDAQRQEWIKLFAINEIKRDLIKQAYSEPLTKKFLKANPCLVLDTKFFNDQFKEKLLASFDNIDGECDGVIINSENFQALKLLEIKYRESVRCIHIDPPYNTQTSGFLYKNEYKHSSWLTMMENRIKTGIALMSIDGSFICHIDENEYERLQTVFECFSIPNAGTIVWDKRNPMNAGRGIATQHEYIIWRSRQQTPIYLRNKNILSMLGVASAIVKKYGRVTREAREEYVKWINNNTELSGGEKANKFLDDLGKVYQSVSLRAPEPRADPKFHEPLIHPVTGKPCSIPPNGFSRTPETLQSMIEKDEIIFGSDETTQPRQKAILTEKSKRQISSVIQDAKKGKADVSPMGLDFPYCHPLSLYKEIVGAAAQSPIDIILDHFGGSGTTAHAVINLNREDGGKRKYILVEMGQHFDTVLKPRIQKIVYSKDWKDGKPVSREGISNMFKYMKLESYDDTLDNLIIKLDERQQKALDINKSAKEDYVLGYMLDIEARESDSLLNIDKFADPFNYTLKIRDDNELKITKIDLVETFNYLIGLYVEQASVIRGFKVIRGRLRTGEKTLVIWRNTKKKSNEELEKFFTKQGYNTQDFEFDKIFVNGDNNLENLKVDDDRWKVSLIEEEFKKRMFDVKDI